MEKPLLEVRDVSVHYGDVQVLWNVNLGIIKGTVVALVGANGAGKTTLLKSISGMVHPSAGKILFEERPLTKIQPEKVVNLGISHVPEGRRLFLTLTVMENLELGAYVPRARSAFGESLERVFELFPVLKSRISQIAGSLSGGEQQMLAIGRALMARPRILMLDEPSLGLSPIIVKTMFELIQNLNNQNMTILLVEQNIYQALKIAHRGFVIKTGKITLTGEAGELISDPEIQKAYMGALE